MLTEPIQELLARISTHSAHDAEAHVHGDAVVESNRVVSAAATFYEKARYLIDYREEHTIRRSAIERILKRRLLIEGKAIESQLLLQELVDGQYIPRESAGAALHDEIGHIALRYTLLWETCGSSNAIGKKLVSFAASEIDNQFDTESYAADEAVMDAWYHTVRSHVTVPGRTEEEIDTQLFCSIQRELIRADDATLSYALWKKYAPEWIAQGAAAADVCPRVPEILSAIKRDIADPLQYQISQKMKDESIYFRIIREVIRENKTDASRTLDSEAKLDKFVHDFLERTYEIENANIKSRGTRAVVYLFVTKMLVALAVEVPYDYFIVGALNYIPLAINAIFHPLLLFSFTRKVGALGEGNTDAILHGLHGVLYTNSIRSIRVATRYSRFTGIFALLYFVFFVGIFGGIVAILQMLTFNNVGITLFLFFLALVSYFAFRIRFRASRWKVRGNSGALLFITNMLAMPLIRAGRWLSTTFSTINILVLIMDFIIETPFKMLLNFSHQFMQYLQEKADEVY